MRARAVLLTGMLGIATAGMASAATGQNHTQILLQPALGQQWAGVYQGVLPCTACDEVRTQLVLQADGQYVLRETWIGKTEILSTRADGWFKWSADRKQVILDKEGDLRRFLIGQGFIEERTAADGSPLHTKMSKFYVLKKVG